MKNQDLAYWYFRLNGFFTMNNFILHPARKGPQKTDCDILGVRFPYRAEFSEQNDFDEKEFWTAAPYFLIAEVATGRCKLNGPWTDPRKQNVDAVFAAIGLFKREEIASVAQKLYEQGSYATQEFYTSFFCVGRSINDELKKQYPSVPQKTWGDLIFFIHSRFTEYKNRKKDHPQWDEIGRELWDLFQQNSDKRRFEVEVIKAAGLPPAD